MGKGKKIKPKRIVKGERAAPIRALQFEDLTKVLLKLAADMLIAVFDYTPDEAVEAIVEFSSDDLITDEWIHHNSSWGVATHTHFCIRLSGDMGNCIFWEVDNGYVRWPKGYKSFMIKYYWDKYDL